MDLTQWESLIRIGLAAVLGGAIGYERATLDKSAGLRTH
ncbi:MAG TPA: methyltransferase, partial [Chloroflexi bacterium]|nr:methyltransferase [Chloroflexota bacterium]